MRRGLPVFRWFVFDATLATPRNTQPRSPAQLTAQRTHVRHRRFHGAYGAAPHRALQRDAWERKRREDTGRLQEDSNEMQALGWGDVRRLVVG